MEPRQLLDFLHFGERLKSVIRHSVTSENIPESVADHSWRLCLFAFALKDEFKDIDMDKVIRMCIIHDLGEAITGDIPAFDKTDKDRVSEFGLAINKFSSFPAPVSTDFVELYTEMEQQKTKEARFYKALDKLEAVIQHNEADLSSWTEHEKELNLTYGYEYVEEFDYLKKLRDEMKQDTLKKLGRV
ncbi:MAG: HD domain-containing protein [Lachnospiraceae bacterium]|nr:HD domain-containing protein [Lachnospiraceae bacterium]